MCGSVDRVASLYSVLVTERCSLPSYCQSASQSVVKYLRIVWIFGHPYMNCSAIFVCVKCGYRFKMCVCTQVTLESRPNFYAIFLISIFTAIRCMRACPLNPVSWRFFPFNVMVDTSFCPDLDCESKSFKNKNGGPRSGHGWLLPEFSRSNVDSESHVL